MIPRVNFTADFADRGGWGRHARGFGAALRRHADVALCGSNDHRSADHCPDGDVAAVFDDVPHPDAVGVALGPAPFLPRAVGSPRVLSTVWETTRVPPPLLARLTEADAIWVPTAWGRDIFVAAGLPEDAVHVVPEGVDSQLFRPRSLHAARERERFRFVCVGKWEARKGTSELVRAFAQEFHADEPVELVMHCDNVYLPWFDLTRAIAEELRAVGGQPPRVVSSMRTSLAGLVGLLRASDAFVLPTRAEAWGLPILEAMACALPCVVTDYGGHRVFADATNAYLIEVERLVPVRDPVNFDPRWDWGTWAEPSIEHIRYLMRHVFEHRDEAIEKGKAARRDAVAHWSWDNAASHAVRHLAAMRSG